jgi:acyl dehydratase
MPEEEITDETLEYDRSIVGVDFEVGSHEVTKEKIASFAKAIGETNPLYLDEESASKGPHRVIIAPPAYYTSIQLEEGPDANVKFGNISFNASQHCEFFEPMCAGDQINAKTQVSKVYAKTGRTGAMVFAVRKTTFTNQHDRTVMIVESSNVRRNVAK